MAWFSVQSLAVVVVGFAIGVSVGWLLRGRRSEPESTPAGVGPASVQPSSTPAGAISAFEPVTAGIEVPVDSPFWTAPRTGPAEPSAAQQATDTLPRHDPPVADEPEAPGAEGAEVAADPEPDSGPEPAADPGVGTEPEPDGGPEHDQPPHDDLTRIDGVSDTMARALAAEGLGSFFAIANASEDRLRRALRVNRIRSAPGIAFWSARAGELEAARLAADAQDRGPTEHDQLTDSVAPGAVEIIAAPPSISSPGAATVAEPGAGSPSDPAPDGETSPLAAAMAALESSESDLAPPGDVAMQESADVPAPAAAPDPDGPPSTREVLSAPTPRTGSAFRTAAQPGGPSWTTISPASSENLEHIIGITPAIATTLHRAGVTNYTQLAAVRDEELKQILSEAGIELPRGLYTWSVQAALLLQGDSESAATLAGGLIFGRENS